MPTPSENSLPESNTDIGVSPLSNVDLERLDAILDESDDIMEYDLYDEFEESEDDRIVLRPTITQSPSVSQFNRSSVSEAIESVQRSFTLATEEGWRALSQSATPDRDADRHPDRHPDRNPDPYFELPIIRPLRRPVAGGLSLSPHGSSSIYGENTYDEPVDRDVEKSRHRAEEEIHQACKDGQEFSKSLSFVSEKDDVDYVENINKRLYFTTSMDGILSYADIMPISYAFKKKLFSAGQYVACNGDMDAITSWYLGVILSYDADTVTILRGSIDSPPEVYRDSWVIRRISRGFIAFLPHDATECCHRCGKPSFTSVSGIHYCRSCFHSDVGLRLCPNCDCLSPKEHLIKVAKNPSKFICSTCFYLEYVLCSVCLQVTRREHSNDGLCKTCYDNRVPCSDCGEFVHPNVAKISGQNYYCKKCYSEKYTTCSSCLCVVKKSDVTPIPMLNGRIVNQEHCTSCIDQYFVKCSACLCLCSRNDAKITKDKRLCRLCADAKKANIKSIPALPRELNKSCKVLLSKAKPIRRMNFYRPISKSMYTEQTSPRFIQCDKIIGKIVKDIGYVQYPIAIHPMDSILSHSSFLVEGEKKTLTTYNMKLSENIYDFTQSKYLSKWESFIDGRGILILTPDVVTDVLSESEASKRTEKFKLKVKPSSYDYMCLSFDIHFINSYPTLVKRVIKNINSYLSDKNDKLKSSNKYVSRVKDNV